MLTPQDKLRIAEEECLRHAVRSVLAESRARKSFTQWASAFSNSAFGIFVMSSVVLGLISFCYTERVQRNEKLAREGEVIRKIDTEIAFRLSQAQTIMNIEHRKRPSFPDVLQFWRIGKSALVGSMSGVEVVVFEEFRDRSAMSLLHELAVILPSEQKKEAWFAIEILREIDGYVLYGGSSEVHQQTHEDDWTHEYLKAFNRIGAISALRSSWIGNGIYTKLQLGDGSDK